jgi:hypothetical protein
MPADMLNQLLLKHTLDAAPTAVVDSGCTFHLVEEGE